MNVKVILFVVQILPANFAPVAFGEDKEPEEVEPLPFVRDFDPGRYLGIWHEVARLPTAIQPPGTLAKAEYTAGKEEGSVKVKNTAFDKRGKKLSDIEGKAKLAEGDPPGRLLVSFGPVLPEAPNYHVMHVDKDYRYAVVGVPDRKAMWILAREVPVAAETLDRLREIGRKAGFDVDKLLIAPWDKIQKKEEKAGAADGSN